MTTLATHFGLGRQMHRCLDVVRTNIDILKCCGMLLLLESDSARPSSSASISHGDFLEISEIRQDLIDASLVPASAAGAECKVQLLYRDAPLQFCCRRLTVRFGLNRRFSDHAGRPKLTFLVDAGRALCELLDVCHTLARTLSRDSGSTSEWGPVMDYNSTYKSYLVRLRIPVRMDTDDIAYATEIRERDPSGETCMVVFDRLDDEEQDRLFAPGTTMDAFVRLDTYHFLEKAGIVLIAEKLVIHST